jgi:hypothetical protein
MRSICRIDLLIEQQYTRICTRSNVMARSDTTASIIDDRNECDTDSMNYCLQRTKQTIDVISMRLLPSEAMRIARLRCACMNYFSNIDEIRMQRSSDAQLFD